ncbi:MAG: DUF3108 domain-containing protein [Alloprevotella sp.]|nr:DUF3108 domain-containing protein [Alloprevotella sp.]
MKTLRAILVAVVLAAARPAPAQCSAPNTAFQSGETLQYELYFNWKFVWVKVGSATWNITKSVYAGKPAYCTTLVTRGSKQADKYFTMRDKLTSYTSLSLVPLFYQKDAHEGGAFRQEKVWYSYPSGQCALKMFYQRDQLEPKNSTYESKHCAFDMLSMMLRARSFDASAMKPGHRIPFLMAEGKRAEWRTLVYRGKKNFKMEGRTTTYRCLVFSYLEKEKGREREIVTFYVTDDANHLPVRLDMNLKFGKAKAYLSGLSGVRNPQTAIVKK